MHEVMTLQLSDTKRVTAYYDETHYTMLEALGECLKVQPLTTADRVQQKYLSTDDEHAAAISRFVNSFHYFNHEKNYRELRERAIGLYFGSLNIPYKFVTLNDGSSWAEVVIYDDVSGGEWILQHGSERGLEAWFNGEIYVVALEELEVYTNYKNNTLERWEVVDSLGGCIIEDLTLETAQELFGAIIAELQAA